MNIDEKNLNTGFSVYIDQTKFKSKDDSASNFFNNDNFKSTLNKIYPKYINKWVDESLILNCQLCKAEFGWFITGKHHCRACGCVFCSKCCNKHIKIPEFIKRPEEKETFRTQLSYLRYGK